MPETLKYTGFLPIRAKNFSVYTADSTLMKHTRQAIERCRETALPCPLSKAMYLTYLKNAVGLKPFRLQFLSKSG
jgi:hypothetical protein